MKSLSSSGRWDTLLVAAVVLTAGVCANAQQTIPATDEVQPENESQSAAEPEGPIVEIMPMPGGLDIDLPNGPITGGAIVDEPNQAPAHWIGLSGRSVLSPVLRTQLQLAEDLGVVVEQVVPDSPAAKADIRRHDVILRAGGEPVLDMRVLQQVVLRSGSEPIELQLIRMGQETTVTVVPEKRPAGALVPRTGQGPNILGRVRSQDQLQRLLEQLQRRGNPHPQGLGGLPGMGRMPADLSVSITREGDGPIKVTVKRGGDSWEIVADDPTALEQLPEEIRPFVERMLPGAGSRFDLGLPNFNGGPLDGLLPPKQPPEIQLPDSGSNQMLERMEKLEERFRELQQRLEQEQ
jgi:PDZ domain-containing protein